MSLVAQLVLVAGLVMAAAFAWAWRRLERRTMTSATARPGRSRPTAAGMLLGAVTNFFDTLGNGSFASTTAYLKFRRLVRDELIPGTLNVGHALPTIAQAIIFTTAIAVAPLTLVSMVVAAVAGGYLGAGIVAGLPRRAVQIGMGLALLVAAGLFTMKIVGVLPPGGTALGLTGGVLVFAVIANFCLGALMSLGIGLYAPCLMLVSLLGMNPIAAFPIMMASCACLMPVGSLKFIRERKYDRRTAVGLAIGGIPGVLVAAFIVKSLPLAWLYWLVVVVVLYAAILMLRSALQESARPGLPATDVLGPPQP
ncbi:MAG TPA: sulfite exporter TauE/SafE family protein [Steroidobacteraceae bacterium]|nr:sulfite exporter TauE/SafE family protein [Steroidobacteraceae bacterium]